MYRDYGIAKDYRGTLQTMMNAESQLKPALYTYIPIYSSQPGHPANEQLTIQQARPSRVNIILQLLNCILLIGDYGFDDVVDGNDADHNILFKNGKVAEVIF